MSPTVTDHTTLSTPLMDRGALVTAAISQATRALDTTNDDDELSAERPKYLKLTSDQLSQLLTACSTPTSIRSPTADDSPVSITSLFSKHPAYVNNAKYEAICCRPITPTYDGTEADLVPFLLRLDIRRQDEGWAPATYVKTVNDKQYDLTLEFSQVTELDVLAIAKQRWTAPTVSDDKHTIGHDTCNARLLAKCLLASISSDLSMMILNRTPTQYCNDGTYILWAISNNIYRNNIAFVETI
jgi:hypothetical protein